jgi:hypothetical protein
MSMNMRRFGGLTIVAIMAGAGVSVCRAQDPGPRFDRRWFYAASNLLVAKNVDELIALIERAGKAGYNGMLLADYKLNILDRMPTHYFEHTARVRKAAEAAKVEIIPSVFPIGYSEGILAHDPNLAEGMPVEKIPFLVKGREASLVPKPASRLLNGGLEEAQGHAFARFSFQDDPGKATFADRSVVHGGKTSCRMQDVARNSSSGNARLIQRVTVRPHGCYRFSCWAKTKDLASPDAFHLTVIGAREGARPLTFFEGGLQATQGWTQLDVVFNTLDQDEVILYVGLWGGGTGTLWVDDLKLEELSLVNVLRREGCPLTVTSSDGRTTFQEGRDFEPIRDPDLGQVPYAGIIDFRHAGPRVRITANSRIKDGDTIHVSWYHPVIVHGYQVMCCLSDPKLLDVLRDQARRVNDLYHPKTFLMSHDEIRVANWCRACQTRKKTPGALLADNTRKCVEILRAINPKARVAVWSDMYDPQHNAVDGYYLVNGTLKGSWEGLDRDVIVANWNSGHAKESLRWFADRGHPQLIAGYYDVDDLSNFRTWEAASRGIPKVQGFMYTTWQHKYRLLETYADAMRGKP